MKKLLILVLTLFVLVGCQKSGEEFVGSWVNDYYSNKTMEVTKDGDSFIINVGDQKLVGKMQDSHLNVDGGMAGTIPMTMLDNGKVDFTFMLCGEKCSQWTRKK